MTASLIAWLGSFAWSAYPMEVRRCLNELDVSCAHEELVRLDAQNSRSGDVVAALAHTLFQEGKYPTLMTRCRVRWT